MAKIAGACTGLQDCSVMQNSNFKRLKKRGGKAFKCVLIYGKVMETWSIERERDAGGARNCVWRDAMHLFRVVTSANKLSVGNDSEEEKERKKELCMLALLPRQDRGVASGIIRLGL